MKNKGCLSAGSLLIGIGVIIGIIILWAVPTYNSFISLDEKVSTKWANVQTVYQKRANLIPNLERTVKSYAQFEQNTLTSVIEARSKATGINIDPSKMTEQDLAKFQAAQGQLTGALSRLMAVVEQYPNLKADQQYINFQREYTEIENSIRVEMVNFNQSVDEYNKKIRQVPANIIANFTNFLPKPKFQAELGAEKAPDVFK